MQIRRILKKKSLLIPEDLCSRQREEEEQREQCTKTRDSRSMEVKAMSMQNQKPVWEVNYRE